MSAEERPTEASAKSRLWVEPDGTATEPGRHSHWAMWNHETGGWDRVPEDATPGDWAGGHTYGPAANEKGDPTIAARVSVPTEPGAPDLNDAPRIMSSLHGSLVCVPEDELRAFLASVSAASHSGSPMRKSVARIRRLARASRPVPAAKPLRDAAGRSPEWYDGYNAAMRDYNKRVPAPEPSARLREELDAEMAGTEDWTEGPDDYLDIRIGLVRRIRAALAATPQDPGDASH